MRLKWLAAVALISALTIGRAEAAPLYTFTNAGATGRLGPTQSQADAAYGAGVVVISGSGVQAWSVPTSGLYHVTAAGAQGTSGDASHIGGLGAVIQGDFFLTVGQILQIAVGQVGLGYPDGGPEGGSNGGGGGGSFVVDSLNNPLLIAGGGGGTRTAATVNGFDGQAGQFGTTGSGFQANGTGGGVIKVTGLGNGGVPSSFSYGSAGAGFFSDGANDQGFGFTDGFGGSSWFNGLVGGQIGPDGGGLNAQGGFGGGGAGNGFYGGGGGGGYSGGDGGFIAGGGGSYNTGLNPLGATGAHRGQGFVTFEFLDAPAPTPEPASVLLLGMGSGLMFVGKKLRRKRTSEMAA